MKSMGYPDKPVASISEDLFNVEVYVNALCSFIRSCDTPMTVSIQSSVGFNPRSMKRLFNTFELLDIVTESTVNNIDSAVRRRVLFAIICTQMCFEKLYLYFTSTRIDEDTFTALRNEASAESALREIYGLAMSEVYPIFCRYSAGG